MMPKRIAEVLSWDILDADYTRSWVNIVFTGEGL